MTRRRKATIDRDPDTGRIFVTSVDQIPVFASDEDEVEFWNTHEPTLELGSPGYKSPEEIFRRKGLKQLPKR
jgi:hypothetical protein